jgi:hypothetical protein
MMASTAASDNVAGPVSKVTDSVANMDIAGDNQNVKEVS